MRRLCSERPPPEAFRDFAPRARKGGETESGEGAGKTGSPAQAKAESSGGGGGGGGGSGGGGGEGGGGGPRFPIFDGGLLTGLAAAAAFTLVFGSRDPPGTSSGQKEISMQHFLTNMLATGRVKMLSVVNGNLVRVHLHESAATGVEPALELLPLPGSSAGPSSGEPPPAYFFTIGSLDSFEERLESYQTELGIPLREHVPVQFVTQRSWVSEASRYVPSLLLIGFFIAMSRGAMSGMGGMGAGGGLFNVGKSKAVKASKVETRFKDVAGLQEAKVEVMEFVDILKKPERYTKLGAKIPKGALLVGPPGCGKTLLAKATAGESQAPFYSISGSDFIEMFVGVGPARVRDLFAQARANAPCLIFIDEIDAVGRARGKGGFGGNDERENTLNQLLIELDGFTPSSGVVVLAGTNRADVLDPALLRPGRFDRQIVVDLPDIRGRTEIFGVHLAGITLDGDAETFAKKMAALTPGFSGADVANICNEAALIAARRKLKAVDAKCFDAAIDRVIAGIEKKDLTIDPHERRVIAFHEAGHALCGWLLEHADPVMKVSIVPRGKAALGYSQSLPRDVPLYTQSQLGDMMCMALGGRAAEQVRWLAPGGAASRGLRLGGLRSGEGGTSGPDLRVKPHFTSPRSPLVAGSLGCLGRRPRLLGPLLLTPPVTPRARISNIHSSRFLPRPPLPPTLPHRPLTLPIFPPVRSSSMRSLRARRTTSSGSPRWPCRR